MEAGNVKEELHKKSPSTPYQDLLKTARRTVGENVCPFSRRSNEVRYLLFAFCRAAYNVRHARVCETKIIIRTNSNQTEGLKRSSEILFTLHYIESSRNTNHRRRKEQSCHTSLSDFFQDFQDLGDIRD